LGRVKADKASCDPLYTKKKILLVGGAGFIGNSLSEVLVHAGHNVFVGDERTRLDKYSIPVERVNYLEFDWQDPVSMPTLPSFDVVIHLAWSSNPLSSMEDIGYDARKNILGTVSLLEAVSGTNISKFIFMSSGGTVYGNLTGDCANEQSPLNPISAYGVSKLACEKYVEVFGAMNRIRVCNLRLGNPYGVYQLQGTPVGVIANFVKNVCNEQEIIVRGSGEAVRDYIHVKDMSAYVEKIVSLDEIEGTYNVGSGTGTSIKKVISTIREIKGSDINVRYIDAAESDVGSIILDCQKIETATQLKVFISNDES